MAKLYLSSLLVVVVTGSVTLIPSTVLASTWLPIKRATLDDQMRAIGAG